MRSDRSRRQWSASAAGAALLLVFSGSAVTISSSPEPSASAEIASQSIGPTEAPSAPPNPVATPTAAAVVDCELANADIDGDDTLVGGDTVRVRFEGFTVNVGVRLDFSTLSGDQFGTIGAGTADGNGSGVLEGLVPTAAPIEEAQLNVVGDDGCTAWAFIVVLGSPDAISIDDAAVKPGQHVAVRVGGFAANVMVGLTIDSAPIQGECYPHPTCRYLGHAETSARGSAVIRARIPLEISPGSHRLWVTGESLDGITDMSLGIDITIVGAAGTMPPTDTVSAG